jgi:hypothetical protein
MAPLALLVVYLGMLGLSFTVRLGVRYLKGGEGRQPQNYSITCCGRKVGCLGMLGLNF